MRATEIALREVIKLWILFFCVHISTLSGPNGAALALKTRSSSGVYDSKNLSVPPSIFSRLHSIRGGDIVYLRSIEETDEVVEENSNRDDQLVVIYFSSTDCPPCKKVSPLFEELSEEFEELGDKIVFCKVNVDENPIAASQYQVTGWPTFLFLKKGEKVLEIVGGKLAEATLYDWVKLMVPKQEEKEEEDL